MRIFTQYPKGFSFVTALAVGCAIAASFAHAAEMAKGDAASEKVSYYEEVRPLFQEKCQGCHQPAKAKGDYVMTDVAKLISGGETGAAVLAHKSAESFLIEQVTPVDGKVEMPPKGDPLTAQELALVNRWINEGAVDDTPQNARQRYDQEHLPVYAVAPVITSLDYSPDGKLLAVAGFHEVLLHKADGTGLVARLVGLSERIESVSFSPDGKRLAVAGGLPGRMGEVQIWDVAKRELELSKPVGFDTAYGASWSPDGKLVAFGLPDNTARAIDSTSGKQVLFMGGHSDWVLDTEFSTKGDYLVSVGRDMAAKLTEVKTERFVDNITSITPGALKGGMNAVVGHPLQDHVLVGGSDGVPQIYRMKRETVRKIGDNANQIRRYPAMDGRIWAVAFRPDGKRFAAVSSLNGKGMINIYKSEYDATITPELKKAMESVRRNPDPNREPTAEEKLIDEFQTRGAELLKSFKVDAAVFSVAYSPDGKTVAAGADDGQVRLIDSETAAVKTAFVPVTVDAKAAELAKAKAAGKEGEVPTNLKKGKAAADGEQLPKGGKVVSLEISPKSIVLDSPSAYNQLVVTGKLEGGGEVDLTRSVKWVVEKPFANVSDRGVARPLAVGDTNVTASFGEITGGAAVKISGLDVAFHPDFIRDVNPVISRLGCNAGLCHGAKDGKNGFKLSLRGYDPLYDVRAFGDDHTARRVNYASPDDSLMLLKATAAVPHEGGMTTEIGSQYYNTIRQWIADGAKVIVDSSKVTSLEVFPKNPVIQNIGARQQLRVVARYRDGTTRDVTHEAFLETGNSEVAINDDFGLMTTVRRGEAPVLARFEGAYAATTLTVMGDREGFTWSQPEAWGEIDTLVAAKWQRLKISPSGLCTDEEFLRRIYIDLTGLPPTVEAIDAFMADKRPTREKRDAVIDSLIGDPEFVEHWTNKWADMLQVNSKFLGKEGATLFRQWIHGQVEANTPYDEFVYSILTATGSNKENPPASYYKILREPDAIMENTTHLFLATRFNCNKCHDHPFERWNQNQYYETAAFFGQIGLARDAKNAPTQNIGGSAVENAVALYEVISDAAEGEVKHDRTGEVTAPVFPFEAKMEKAAFKDPKNPTRREKLAAWMISPDNDYFAMSYANRIWGYMLGTGVIEPLDDIRAGNPATNPELLGHLTKQFTDSGFDVRKLMAEICKSRTYQLSIATTKWNEDDKQNFSHAKARRLPAEVLFDAVYAVTGATPNIPGAKPGMRAAELADAQLDTESGFLATLGRPARESSCECERQSDMQLGSVMSLLSGPSVADAVGADNNAIEKLVRSQPDDRKLIDAVYLRVLNRKAKPVEIDAVLENWSQIEGDHQAIIGKLARAEGEWVPKRAAAEQERLKSIAQAQATIDAYTPEYTANKAKAEAEQKVRIAAAEKAMNDHVSTVLPKTTVEQIAALPISRIWTTWLPQKPSAVAATGGIKLTVQDDNSVIASGTVKAVSDYTVTIPVKSSTVSGFMIEALTDDSLTMFGPGLNPGNGNFVVSEVELSYATAADPKKVTKVKLAAAMADHNQTGFDVKNAINGNVASSDKAWAIGGGERRPHWARFQLEKPLSFDDKGATMTLTVMCRYSVGEYPLGKFRVFTTDSAAPLELGLPTEIATALQKPEAARTEPQKGAIATYFREQDVDYLTKRFAWVQETRPLPADDKMNQLKAALVVAEREINNPAPLLQLRKDVQMSIAQAADRRLTGTQDLTWALINNPAFLFNH